MEKLTDQAEHWYGSVAADALAEVKRLEKKLADTEEQLRLALEREKELRELLESRNHLRGHPE